MKHLFRYLSYLFLIIVLFFFCSNDIHALRFVRGEKDLLKYIPGIATYVKYDEHGNVAYCSDQKYKFYGKCTFSSCGSDTDYYLDTDYGNSKSCTYQVPVRSGNQTVWTTKEGGDCSSIVGFIIAAGHSDTSITDANEKRYWTQAAVWTYLGKFSNDDDLKATNANMVKYYNDTNYPQIKKYIQKGWEEYSKVQDHIGLLNKDDVNFSVSYEDNAGHFYYKPSTGECGSGFYRTRAITITNNENVKINVNLQLTSKNAQVCYGGRCGESYNIVIPSRGSIEVYLKSITDNREFVSLNVIASYFSAEKIQNNIYDSERWLVRSAPSDAQGMIKLITYIDNVDEQVKHTSHKNLTFFKTPVTRLSCSSTSNSNNGTSTAPVSKVCADKSQARNDYVAEFQGCTCFGLDLGNDRYVSVIVTEKSAFSFGKLTPNETLYAGGGFSFAESGYITQYVSKIKWEYANTKDGIPYYYNGNNLNDNDARKIETEINEAIKRKMKTSLSLNFSTRDSNDHLNTNMVIVPLKLSFGSINFNNGIYEFNSRAIKMNHAYFSTDGRVSYNGRNETYSIDGGNKYYVPMNYLDSTFPFDISATDLSIVNGIEFWYQADCDKNVEDLYKSLYYRSINLTNPFPKAGNLTANVPENWRFWYCGTSTICNNQINQGRMENTYQNYPDSPLYEIILNSSKINKISAIDDHYTSWSNINKNGVSEFVTDMNLFEEYASNNSYCTIGEFNENCDK